MSTEKDHDQLIELTAEEKSSEERLKTLEAQTQTNTVWITDFSFTWKFLRIGLGITWSGLVILITYLLVNHVNIAKLLHVAKLH